MMKIGAFDAKTHLSSLLDRVSAGEEVLITRHGKPVARLVPAGAPDQEAVDVAIRRLKEIRTGCTLGESDWKELRDEGRK
jgi:prevent-host-death family protein